MSCTVNPLKVHTVAVSVLALSLVGNVGCGTSIGSPATAGNPISNFSTTAPVSEPLIGYVWDQSAAGLRPIFGVSAAASMGAPLYAGGSYSGAFVSLLRQYALLANKDGQIALVTLPNGEPKKLLDRLSSKQQVTVSPSGKAALIYAPDLSRLTLIQGLPSAPSLQTINLSGSVGPAQAVVGDTGLILAATTQGDGTSTITSFTPAGAEASIETVGQLGGMAFLPHSTSALIADEAQSVLLMASGLGGTPSISRIAGSSDGVAQPTAVAASSDGRWAIVANRKASTISRIDLTGRVPASHIQCKCSPTVLLSLAGNSVFLLMPNETGSPSVFDGDAAQPRILFIAGLRQTSTQGMIR
jgi:DNA-binding beta-propeller fold protein YncE